MDEDVGGDPPAGTEGLGKALESAVCEAKKFQYITGDFTLNELKLLVRKFNTADLPQALEQFQQTCQDEKEKLLEIKEKKGKGTEDAVNDTEEMDIEVPEIILPQVEVIRQKFTQNDIVRLQKKFPTESGQQAALVEFVLELNEKRQKLFEADMCESEDGDMEDMDVQDTQDDLICEWCMEGDEEAKLIVPLGIK